MTLVDLDIVTGKTYNRVCGSVCLCGIWRIECQVASFFPSPLLGQGLKVYRGREMRVGLSSTLLRQARETARRGCCCFFFFLACI